MKLIKKLQSSFERVDDESILELGKKILSKHTLQPYKFYKNIYQKELLQGLINEKVIGEYSTGIWPFWVGKQTSPDSSTFTSPGFPSLLINTTYRNWTTLSAPELNNSGIIDPYGMITPHQNGWSIDTWIANSTKITSPSRLKTVTQKMKDGYPLITTDYTIQDLYIKQETFYSWKDNIQNTIFNKLNITNNSDKSLKFSLILAIRPYNPEGISPINSVSYLTSNAFMVNNRLGVVLDQKPHNIICTTHEDNNITNFFGNWEMILNAKCPQSLSSGYAEYRITLKPKESTSISFKCPVHLPKFTDNKSNSLLKSQKSLNSKIESIKQYTFLDERDHVQQKWKKKTSKSIQITTGNHSIDHKIKQSILHLGNMSTKHGIQQGGFTYKNIHPTENLYISMCFNRIGQFNNAKSILNALSSYFGNKEGASAALWNIALNDYLEFSNDSSLTKLKNNTILKNIKNHRRVILKHIKTNPLKKHHVTTQIKQERINQLIFAIAGLSAGIKSLNHIKSPAPEEMHSILKSGQKKLSNDLALLQKANGSNNIYQDPLTPNLLSPLIGIYPLNVIDPDNNFVKDIIDTIEKHYLFKSLFYNQKGHNGLPVISNFQLIQYHIQNQDPKAHSALEELLQFCSSTGCWPETIHPQTGGGLAGDGHYTWAHAEFINCIRNFLIKEDDQILTISTPREWIRPNDNTTISIKNGHTRFGSLDFSITYSNDKATLNISHGFHTKPKEIRFVSHQKISKIKLAHTEKQINDTVASIPHQAQKIDIFFA